MNGWTESRAAMAIDEGITVQAVEYPKLKAHLEKDNQILVAG